MGIIGVTSFQEDVRHAEAGEFFEHERLVHVVAGQAIRAERDHRVDAPRGGRVSHLIESWPVEAGPGVAVVGAG